MIYEEEEIIEELEARIDELEESLNEAIDFIEELLNRPYYDCWRQKRSMPICEEIKDDNCRRS